MNDTQNPNFVPLECFITIEKPYFVPVNKEYFIKIKSGEQNCEIRPANHRGWNSKNIYPGRWLRFSCGYGNHDRCCREIIFTHEGPESMVFIHVPQWHIDAVERIYGKRDRWLVAFIR